MIRQYVFTLSRRLPEGSMTTCTCRQHLNCRLSGRQFSFDILFANYRQKHPCSCCSFLRKNPPLGAVLCYTIR